ncbi:zinc finger BED domain-containing protein RICESLEEPER 3-like [Triticum dicoccoides]|uniref:zinc finger BED domain-containing protein RICESLEEPER 3-like n=1 Tax=Triticum dicoccoides TaxID=85692 RepID=UPI00189185A8|nr:zinc finger BED domain-containing protein RICESLEEPER 3-like [Triticum dicoccoides]
MEDEPHNSNAMVDQEESTGSAPGPVFSGRKPKRLRSKVWDDFTPIYIDGKLARAECMHCHQVFSSGTGNLRKHQAKCCPRAQKRAMQHKPPFLLTGQNKSSDTAKVDQNLSHGELGTHEQKNLASCDTHTDKDRKNQSHEELAVPDQDIPTDMNQRNLKVGQIEPHEELVRIFSVHGYPPPIQIYDGFSKFVSSLNPMVKMPAKADMYRYSRELFDKEKTKLKEKLAALSSRVCLSAYLWHYDLTSAFLCLSVHYIDDEWEKQKHIIRFHSVDPSCNAKQLSQDILSAIGDWGLRYKVFSITLDDVFLDDSVASDLKASLQEWNLRSANRSSCMSAKHTSSMSANRSLFVARSPIHLVNQVIHVGIDELHKVMEKSTKCSKHTKGHIPSAVRFLNCGYAPSAEEWSNAQRICKILQRVHIYMDEMNTFHGPADLLDRLWGAKRALHPEDSFYGDKTVSKELKKMQQKFTDGRTRVPTRPPA